jgi:hypothetical protein
MIGPIVNFECCYAAMLGNLFCDIRDKVNKTRIPTR